MRKLILFILLTTGFQIYGNNKTIIISINEGKYFSYNYAGYMQNPQIAIWIEDENRNYIDTVYVSEKGAKSKWIGFNVRRPDALPVWSYKRNIKAKDGLFMPDKTTQLPDSLTGATPKKSFEINWKIPEKTLKRKYFINVEVNTSFDYNETYKKNLPKSDRFYNDANGQPSIIWSGLIDLEKSDEEFALTIEGIGEIMEKNGVINKDLSQITTAKDLLSSIFVKIL